MRKSAVICLLIAVAALAAPKLKIAFIGIEPSGVSASVAAGVSVSFRDALINTRRFEVVERERLEALMEEQGLALSGCVTTECFVQVGQLAGAQKVIVGEVAQVGGSYIVSVRMVDVYSGKVEQSLSEVSRSLEGLLTAANTLAVKLSETISVEGTVISVSGNTIKTDLGSQDGVNVNDTVYLVRLGKEHYHPETGLLLGRDIKELGTATITRILADELSEAVLKGSFSVVVGDKVRLAASPSGVPPVTVPPVETPTVEKPPEVRPSGAGRIAFNSSRDGDLEIFVMDSDGRNQTQLTNNTSWDSYPAWSPDGRRIAFSSDPTGEIEFEIFVMDADGRNQTQLTTEGGMYPAWSPDSRRIAFIIHSKRTYNMEVFVMDADGHNLTQLTEYAASMYGPAWSPDGHRIAFESVSTGKVGSEIFVMDADGRNQTQLTTRGGYCPAWSPDGRRIAFQSKRDGKWQIYVMDADGGNQTQLTNDSSADLYPAWSPDGRRIAFESNRIGGQGIYASWEIFVMDADGRNQTQLTTSGDNRNPAWCPVE
ncbi:MAG TPA: CsgG/HfaB family protein [bacterium]|nr:CsgG/HfaB family protein [bacterium]